MNSIRLLLLLGTVVWAGCVSERQSYVNSHPELAPGQRKILVSGKIPGGDAVAGLTREQVKLAMGGDPTTFDKGNGEDIWVFVRQGPVELKSDDVNTSGSSFDKPQSLPENGGPEKVTKTTVYFRGDVATHAEVRDE